MKKHLKALLALILAFTLSGCAKFRMTYDVDKNGNLTGTIATLYSMRAIESFNPSMTDVDREELLSALKEEMQESYPDATITYVSEGEGKDAYAGYIVSGITEIEGIEIAKEGFKLTLKYPIVKVAETLAQENGLTQYSTNLLVENGFEATVDFNMPGKPESNIGEITGNTVHIDLLDLPAGVDTAIITCSVFPLIPVAVGGGVLILLVIILALRKK